MSGVFDTLEFAQTLRDTSKLNAERAEGISEAFAEASSERLATKTDVGALATKLESVSTRLDGFATKSDIAAVKSDVAALASKLEGFATKAEVASLRAETREGFLAVRNEFRTEIAPVKAEQRVMKWMIGFNLALTVAVLFMMPRR